MILSRYIRKSSLLNRVCFHYHNFYDTLELQHDATQQEVKKKYYQLAKKYHPDGHNSTNNSQRFIKIKEAYQTLGDEKKRKNYDNKFYSNQHYSYDHNSYHSGQPYGTYKATEERREDPSFWQLLKRSYLTIFFYIIYGYFAYTFASYFMIKLDKHQRQQKQLLIDTTPGITSRRREYYQKQMKNKNIYALPCQVKAKTLVKQSTKSIQKRKDSILSIQGIQKMPSRQQLLQQKTQYM